MSDNELVVYDERPLTAADVRVQVNLIQEVMKGVMQKGQHYGVVPGCGDKPTLLKPGAEKLMATFRLSADPEVEDLSSNDVLRYRVKCKLLSQSGSFKGAGIGECSSEEDKYKWRRTVSESEWNATPETHRRIKYRYDKEEKQIRTNPYDLANTILKMAKKRSLVDAVLTVTAASDIFTQDIEDMPEEVLNQRGKPTIAPPQTKKAEAKAETTASGDLSVKATIEKTSSKTGKKGNKEWTLYGILAGGKWYNTFDPKLFEIAENYKGSEVEIVYQATERGNNLVAIICDGSGAISGAIPDDCTSNPATCPISKFDEGGKPFCGDNDACQYGIAPKEETTEEPF